MDRYNKSELSIKGSDKVHPTSSNLRQVLPSHIVLGSQNEGEYKVETRILRETVFLFMGSLYYIMYFLTMYDLYI